MKLSIIVPVYNVKNYIRECLDSIKIAMTDFVRQVEVIVINDGSTDGSRQIVDEYLAGESFTIIHQVNSGVAAARNTGMSLATGDWLWFVDSDDWVTDGSVRKIIESIDACHDAEMLLFDAYEDRKGKSVLWEHFSEDIVWNRSADIFALWKGVLYFPLCINHLGKTARSLAAPWDKIYSCKFLKDNDIYFREDLKVLDDMVFNMEVCGAARHIEYVKYPIYHYRILQGSISHGFKPERLWMDLKVWGFIDQYIEAFNSVRNTTGIWNISEMQQALYLRVVKSYGICCTQLFFNRNNKSDFRNKISCAKDALSIPIYREAFQKSDLCAAEIKLKPLILFGRWRFGMGIWLLSLLQTLSCK